MRIQSKATLVLALNLIGWESGSSFLDQSQSDKSNTKLNWITFNTQLQIALSSFKSCYVVTYHVQYLVRWHWFWPLVVKLSVSWPVSKWIILNNFCTESSRIYTIFKNRLTFACFIVRVLALGLERVGLWDYP